MARGRAKWKLRLNPAAIATKAFWSMADRFPKLTAALNYHPTMANPSKHAWAHSSRHDLAIGASQYRPLYDSVAQAAVDAPVQMGSPFGNVCNSWMVEDVIVHGHTLRMVETGSGVVVSQSSEKLRWAHAYPQPFVTRRIQHDGLVCSIPSSEDNYYHLVINWLLPIAFGLLRHKEDIGDKRILLAVREPRSVIVRIVEALRTVGLDISIIKMSPFDVLESKWGFHSFTRHPDYHPSHGYWAGEEAQRLIAALDRVIPGIATPDKIYIRRTDTRVRNLTNEETFSSALQQMGFASLVASWSNFDLQYRSFRQAREIVGVHGAGLSNVCWSRPATRVIELMPGNARRSHFLQIGAECQLDYRLFFAGPEGRNQSFDVNVPAFVKFRNDLGPLMSIAPATPNGSN